MLITNLVLVLVFTSDARMPNLPETRPFLVQVPNQPISLFYDDFDSINVQLIDGSGPSIKFTPREQRDSMTFSVTNFKDDTAAYLTYLDSKDRHHFNFLFLRQSSVDTKKLSSQHIAIDSVF